MATSPNVITAPSAPPTGSNYDQIHAAISEPEPSQAGTETESAAPTEPEAPEVSQPDEQAEVVAEAPAVEPETQEANPYDEPEEDFKPQTLQEILRTPDGKKMYANHKTLREITKAIGHAPTVEQATQYYGAFREIALLNEYISSGDPKRAVDVVSHLFDPQVRGEGAQIVAAQFAPTLAKTNPEAYAAAAQPFITNYGNELWSRYESATNPELKQALYLAAQLVSKDFTGKYRPVKGGAPAAPQADPLAEQRTQLEVREQALQRAEQERQVAADQQWTRNINDQIRDRVDGELDKALTAVKKTYGNAPGIYQTYKANFHNIIQKEAPKNTAAWDIFRVNLGRARRTGSDIEPVIKEYVSRLAAPVIMAHRKKFIEEAGVSAVQASDAKHAELRSIDSHKAPSNGGSPVKPVTGQPLQRSPGETQSAFNLRLLRS